MTSPPRRPIISLKFKKPELEAGESSPSAPPKPAAPPAPVPPPARHKTEFVFKPSGSKAPAVRDPFQKPSHPLGKPGPAKAPAGEKTKPAPVAKPEPAEAKPRSRKGPAISPDVFKSAIRAAGMAIQNVVADPEWKSEDLLHQYQAAKEHATSTHKQQAKLVSTVATRRHSRDIEHADVENAAMRAAYAAALVALVEAADKGVSENADEDADETPNAEA
jgi:hypothetical protein